MLNDRPEEQMTLFKEIIYKKLTVREAEQIARKIATDRIRKKEYAPDPKLIELENQLQETLGTRVHIERKENGGQIKIDFFSNDDLQEILNLFKSDKQEKSQNLLEKFISRVSGKETINDKIPAPQKIELGNDDDEDLYDIKNFSI